MSCQSLSLAEVRGQVGQGRSPWLDPWVLEGGKSGECGRVAVEKGPGAFLCAASCTPQVQNSAALCSRRLLRGLGPGEGTISKYPFK